MRSTKLIPLCIVLTGCFAPGDNFDDFVRDAKRSAPEGGVNTDAGPGSDAPLTAEQIDGTYLYAVSVPLAPTKPTVYLAEVDAEPAANGQLEVSIRQLALNKADRKSPVGEWSPWRTSTLDPTGTYMTEPFTTVVPAEANAATGFETETSIAFTGTFINPATPAMPDAKVQFFCGTGMGMATRPLPISLNGSTFAAVRVEDPEDRDSYPDVVINCNMDPAQPL